MTEREAELVIAFKRGVEFRENTNAPVPKDVDVLVKLELRLDELHRQLKRGFPMSEVPRAEQRIAVWPCDHGNVIVEPGPAKKEYRCSRCGATATTYVEAAAADRLAEATRRYVNASYDGEIQTPEQRQAVEAALEALNG